MLKGSFDPKVIALFMDLLVDASELKVERINSTMLLKGLLEAEESPLYDAILMQTEDLTFFPYMIEETYEYLPVPLEVADTDAEKTDEEDDDENTPCIVFKTTQDTLMTMYFHDDLRMFLGLVLGSLNAGEIIDIWKLTALFVFSMSKDVIKVLRSFCVHTDMLSKYFSVKNDSSREVKNTKITSQKIEIPQSLKGFVRNLNEEMKEKTCDISGRDRECAQVWQTLQKYSKSNAVLLGEPGVGKTSIVVKMVHDILNGTCPEMFKDFTVLSLDVASSVAGTMYRGQAEERFSALVDYLDNQPKVILFIDEIHLINGAGACREGEIDLANTLKPILAGGSVKVIGATTRDEYENYFSRDGALKRRFRPVYVKEPKMKEVYPMLQKSIETLSNFHGVSITEEMVDFIILNAACFNNETCNPDRTKDLIDLAMVVAKQNGKTEVDRESVLANFQYHFKMFAKMSDRAKRSTAYHEAGHCLVALCSKELNNYKVIAVSIMPSDSYLGVTVFEDNDVTPDPTMEYYIDSIAVDLAGRVAEKMFTRTITSGARADLLMATKTAYNIISKYGMADFGINRAFTDETTNDKVKDRINEEIDKIIGKAMKRAEDILSMNHDALRELVEELMKNGIVGPKDLERILKNIQKT